MNREEVKEIQGKLEYKFQNGRVEYIGCERFTVAIKNQIEIEGREFFIDQYMLFDNNLQEILPAREYDSIYMCTHGLIVVSKNSLPTFSEDNTFTRYKKFGLIDLNGNQLLPCEYEKASPKLDGSVELSREGIDFFVPISEIIEAKYNWEVYRNLYKN